MTGAGLGQKQCRLVRVQVRSLRGEAGVNFAGAGWECTKNFNPRRTLIFGELFTVMGNTFAVVVKLSWN